MGNCLFKRLNVVTSNDSLIKMDEIQILNPTARTGCKLYATDTNGEIVETGDGHFTVNGDNVVEVPLNNTIFDYTPGNNSRVVINNKYKLRAIYFNNINVNDLKYSPIVDLYSSYVQGNIESIPNSTYRLSLLGGDIAGDLSECPTFSNGIQHFELISLPNIICSNFADFIPKFVTDNTTLVQLSHMNIHGTIENIVARLRSMSGLTISSLRINFYDTKVTFGESIALNNYYGNSYLKWTADSIIYQCGTDADVADTSKRVSIYAKGVSQSQIDTWESQNNRVYIVE